MAPRFGLKSKVARSPMKSWNDASSRPGANPPRPNQRGVPPTPTISDAPAARPSPPAPVHGEGGRDPRAASHRVGVRVAPLPRQGERQEAGVARRRLDRVAVATRSRLAEL